MNGRLDAEPILVAGVGNVFRSDDGFGSAVAAAMLAGDVPDGVRVVDYGIRGVHLAFDLSEVRTLILVDTVPEAGGPGSIVVQEVDPDPHGSDGFDAHSMDPATVLAGLAALGDSMPRTLVIGCQPACLDDGIGLSPAVEAAVPIAARNALELALSELADMKGIP